MFLRHFNVGLFSRHPESGGAFKVQIYSPYIVVNKTGMPFVVKPTKTARTGSRDSAGDTSAGKGFPISHAITTDHGATESASTSMPFCE